MSNPLKNPDADNFVDWYLVRGFGAMNKNDIEVWVFNHLIKSRFQYKTNYQISIELKIPEAKVKRLRYEAELKYSTVNEDERKKQLGEKIRKARFIDTKEGQIKFSLEDKVLRSYLQDVLTKDGRFYDSSFMSNIIVLSVSDFLYLLEQLYADDWTNMVKKVKAAKNPQTLPTTLPEALKQAGTNFCKKLLERFAGDAACSIINCIKETFINK